MSLCDRCAYLKRHSAVLGDVTWCKYMGEHRGDATSCYYFSRVERDKDELSSEDRDEGLA